MELNKPKNTSDYVTANRPASVKGIKHGLILMFIIVITVIFIIFGTLLLIGRIPFFNPSTKRVITPNYKVPADQTITPQLEDNAGQTIEVSPDQVRDPVR